MDIKTIQTPNKHKVELKAWITGREKRELRSIFLKEMNFGMQGGETEIKEIKGDIIDKAEDKAIETVVISVDGKKENIVNAVLLMNSKDYDFIIKEINKITKDTDFLE